MRNCRSRAARASTLVLGISLLLAGAVRAAEELVEAVPQGDYYLVSAVLTPGETGGEVCGGERDGAHVHFRVSFGADGALSVNGASYGSVDPDAMYRVDIECRNVAGTWHTTTNVTNVTAGSVVAVQSARPVSGTSDEVRASGGEVVALVVS